MSQSQNKWQQKYIQKYGEISPKTLLKGNLDIAVKTAIPMILPLVGLTGAVGYTINQILTGGFAIGQYLHLTPKLVINGLVPGLVYFIGTRRSTYSGEAESEHNAIGTAQMWLKMAITVTGVALAIVLNTATVLSTYYHIITTSGFPSSAAHIGIALLVLLIGLAAPVVVWKKIE